ncbi:hypothetical protein LJR235_002870 [Pararhizobium sp. LjRoot235]|uniref:hypothetical protein n=1 Tax=Pararhizobium sp. LjRoot235 TaxID=3342291 RepID=UPI003ECF7827
MPRTLIGVDSTGIGCIKIMKSNSDDPRTTADTARSKFLYNSKFDVQPHIWGFRDFNAGTSGLTYVPSGSNASNYEYAVEQGLYYVRNTLFGGLQYNMPVFDVKLVRNATWPVLRYKQNIFTRKWSGKYYNDNGGYYATLGASIEPWCSNFASGLSAFGTLAYGWFVEATTSDDNDNYNQDESRRQTIVLWNLPGNSGAITDAQPTTPTVGKRAVRITSTSLKIAKPGYDAATATGTQLAFDSTRNGMKIIAAADVSMPTGNSEYDTGIDLPDDVLADVHFYETGSIYYPSNPQNLEFGADYYFSGTKIKFVNGHSAGRARFMIYARDGSAASSGSNRVLRQTTIGGVEVVQFLRPGSGLVLTFADIVIDSRWPAVQLLAEGYFAVGTGSLTEVINVANASGMFLMVKYMTVHGAGATQHGSFSSAVRMPYVKTLVRTGGHAGDSTYARMIGTQVTFFTHRGEPGDVYLDANASGHPEVTEAVQVPVTGIRYYIFGIPA